VSPSFCLHAVTVEVHICKEDVVASAARRSIGPTVGRVKLTLPTPPLVDAAAGIILRPWRVDDATALAAAWTDPAVARHCEVPPDSDLAAASRWIAGWTERLERGLALDLVAADTGSDAVIAEVGLWPFPAPGSGSVLSDVVEVGWWTVAARRRQGFATAAARLVVGWALASLAPARLVARIPPGSVGSERVATGAGLTRRGRLDDHHDLWVCPRAIVHA